MTKDKIQNRPNFTDTDAIDISTDPLYPHCLLLDSAFNFFIINSIKQKHIDI